MRKIRRELGLNRKKVEKEERDCSIKEIIMPQIETEL
jgi:hypothetical protein